MLAPQSSRAGEVFARPPTRQRIMNLKIDLMSREQQQQAFLMTILMSTMLDKGKEGGATGKTRHRICLLAITVFSFVMVACVVEMRTIPTMMVETFSDKRRRVAAPSQPSMTVGSESTRESPIGRVYPIWNNYSYCSPSGRSDPMNTYAQKQPIQSGFLFVKNEKSASSTSAVVHSRIAKQVGLRILSETVLTEEPAANGTSTHPKAPICENRGETHLWSTRLQKNKACNPHFKCLQGRHQNTFLWTMIRDANKQVVSLFFHFFVSMGSANATNNDDFDKFIMDQGRNEFYYRKLVAPKFNESRIETDDQYISQAVNETCKSKQAAKLLHVRDACV